MKRLTANIASLLAAGALLGLNAAAHADATHLFSLAVDSANTSNISALNPGDTVKLDVLFQSNGTDAISSYSALLAVDPSVFNPNSLSYAVNSNNGFDLASPLVKTTLTGANATGNAPYLRVFGAGEANNNGHTIVFSNTPTLLGTFTLTVAAAPTQGASNIFFTDTLPTKPASTFQSKYSVNFATSVEPSFANNGIPIVVAGAAPVPEAGTLVSLAAMLVPAGLFLRRKRANSAA